jgi:hypothetical protein
MTVRTIAEAEQQIRRLQTEVANLRRQVAREKNITRCVLSAVADFGGAIAMDRCTGFAPAAPETVLSLVDSVAKYRDEHRRPVFIEPVESAG